MNDLIESHMCSITISVSQLTLPGFKQLFHSDCNVTDGTYKGVGAWEGGWGCWEWVASRRHVKATIKTQTAVVCVQ